MKTRRQAKILELIQQNNVETQEELSAYLEREGYQVTQATVSRDIRELKLTKIATDNGRQKYAVIADADIGMLEKYARVLREGYVSMDIAQNQFLYTDEYCDAIQYEGLVFAATTRGTVFCMES